MGVGALGAEDYNIIGESVGGRLFFAGEATNPKYPATMHGAFQSGQSQVGTLGDLGVGQHRYKLGTCCDRTS